MSIYTDIIRGGTFKIQRRILATVSDIPLLLPAMAVKEATALDWNLAAKRLRVTLDAAHGIPADAVNDAKVLGEIPGKLTRFKISAPGTLPVVENLIVNQIATYPVFEIAGGADVAGLLLSTGTGANNTFSIAPSGLTYPGRPGGDGPWLEVGIPIDRADDRLVILWASMDGDAGLPTLRFYTKVGSTKYAIGNQLDNYCSVIRGDAFPSSGGLYFNATGPAGGTYFDFTLHCAFSSDLPATVLDNVICQNVVIP